MRKVILDTETTGLKPEDGHRIIEIGGVEVVDGKKTGRTIQLYINPEREVDEEAVKVHGLTNEFLKDKPKFAEVVDEFLKFVKDSVLVIHNADFDLKFLNSELDRLNKGKIWDYISNAICSLRLDRRLFSEDRRHTLDAICERFKIDASGRTFHGALLDSELLAECYERINEIYPVEKIEREMEQIDWVRPEVKRYSSVKLVRAEVSKEEESLHEAVLARIAEKEKVEPIFMRAKTAAAQTAKI